jgi:hypothetical protein
VAVASTVPACLLANADLSDFCAVSALESVVVLANYAPTIILNVDGQTVVESIS